MTDAEPAQAAAQARWWQSGVIYQIYPRSFADSNGDGIGDLEGVRRGLDHLAWLGVDAIWLSPIYRSPMADFGYDVSDHCDVDPVFGSLEDLDRLVADAHERGIKVVLDWVPNHTSDQHPWFRDPGKRDWYVWRDGPPNEPPNDWAAAFAEPATGARDAATGELRRVREARERHAGTAWTYDETSGQHYLHLFLPEQPDLDWNNPEVEAAMHGTLRFWLDRGVDGFRADVVHMIGKDVSPEGLALPQDAIGRDGHGQVHPLLRRIRSLLDGYDGDRMVVGEVFILDPAEVADFYGTPEEPELHLSFNFVPLFTRWRADRWRDRIAEQEAHIDGFRWPTWVLSNHDNVRHRSRYGNEQRARAAALLLLGLRGTPFLYAGEELGLEDAVIPAARAVDPGGRDGCRAPVPWTRAGGHGWGADPWLPFPPDAGARSVEAMRADGTSILHLYRALLAARRASPALHSGSMLLLDGPEGVLAWDRTAGDDRRRVLVNMSTAGVDVSALAGGWTVEVATDDRPFDGALLPPDQGVLLRRVS